MDKTSACYRCLFSFAFNFQLWKKYMHKVKFTILANFHRAGNGNPLQYSCLESPVDGGAR